MDGYDFLVFEHPKFIVRFGRRFCVAETGTLFGICGTGFFVFQSFERKSQKLLERFLGSHNPFNYLRHHGRIPPDIRFWKIWGNKRRSDRLRRSFCRTYLLFTSATTFLNASGWLCAKEASIFRFNAIFFSFSRWMNWLYETPSDFKAADNCTLQSCLNVAFFLRLSLKAYCPALVRACLASLRWLLRLWKNPLVFLRMFLLLLAWIVPRLTLGMGLN